MAVTVDDMKHTLRVQHNEEDALIGSLIAQARAAAEDYCRVPFGENMPMAVELAVKLMVGHFYEVRDSSDARAYDTMMTAFYALLYPHRDLDKMF